MKFLPLAAFLLVFPLLAVAADKEPFGRMTVDEVSTHLGQAGFFVFDANSDQMYASGHVPGAKHVSYRTYPQKALPADRTSTLIFYCANPICTASHDAARRAIQFGFKKVYVMTDGIEGWKNANKPIAR
jgi:rhodanese-related sulfurtransferase